MGSKNTNQNKNTETGIIKNPIFWFSVSILITGIVFSILILRFSLEHLHIGILLIISLTVSFLSSYLCLKLIHKKPKIDETKLIDSCTDAFRYYLKKIAE
jgi:hypothetical protein